ncbi:hypothetical protein ACFV9E_37195 [Streptomyces sp. NPDC059835]|uniref:hypothetical protein n=1 Tax=Streptomyces sp. NPDC059835 TaxID=3346967 RepID=UPI00365C918D
MNTPAVPSRPRHYGAHDATPVTADEVCAFITATPPGEVPAIIRYARQADAPLTLHPSTSVGRNYFGVAGLLTAGSDAVPNSEPILSVLPEYYLPANIRTVEYLRALAEDRGVSAEEAGEFARWVMRGSHFYSGDYAFAFGLWESELREATPTTAVDAPFLPVIVTHPFENTDGFGPRCTLPEGTDPGGLRIVRADEVECGDWYLGECDGRTPSRRSRWGRPYTGWTALPVVREADATVAMDGETFNWSADEWVMIIPRVFVPGSRYVAGDRVERSVEYIPDVHDTSSWRRTRQVIQRGTVATPDEGDGTLTVEWDGDWGTFRTMPKMIRRVDPTTVHAERSTFGFAVGDRVQSTATGAIGVAVELGQHWYAGDRWARVTWQPQADEPARSQTVSVTYLTRAEG